jgi:GPH family glycoside/pentoside/hexuronide:cation symporter
MGRIEEAPLSFRETAVYNLAGFSLNIYETILAAWILFFYIPPENLDRVRYIPMALMGVILAGGRILDAVTDPLIGYLSDHTRSRWGRRKPYIFVSAPFLFVSFVLIWLPPVNDQSILNALFLAVVLFFYYWAYTGVLIPWFAFLPEMRQENKKRVKVATIGVAIGVIGALVGGGLSGPLLEKLGPSKMALVLGALAFFASELTLFGIQERQPPSQAPSSPGLPEFVRTMKQMFTDRQVLSFAITIMLVQLTYQLMLMNVPYFTTLILKGDESAASMLMGKVILIIALSMPLWYWLLSKFPKRRVFRFTMLAMIVGFVLGFFVGKFPLLSMEVQAVLVFGFVAALIGGVLAVALGLIADLTDYDELKAGYRREAMYYGIYGIVRKTGWATCSLIMVSVFGLFGFSPEKPMGVRVIWLVCALACFLGWIAFIPYKVGDSKAETRAAMNLGTQG